MLLNVIGKSARADIEPMYLFDRTKVNANMDFKFGFNKFIPINGPVGDNVVLPLKKAQPGSVAQFILDYLDLSIQKAFATPEIRQGVPSKDQRTLGETQLLSAGVDTRYSLTARDIVLLDNKRVFQRKKNGVCTTIIMCATSKRA